MKRLMTVAMLTALTATGAGMKTEWGEKVTADNAWKPYPRPQMLRMNWTNLNGLWDYAITSNVDNRVTEIAKGKILVPFCFESQLSGVNRLIEPHETMVYTRKITVEPKKDFRQLLNFEAVDWRAQVFVNGVEACVPHEGGNLPFTVDITDFVKKGENELKVVVWDPTGEFMALGGKQNEKTQGCFYTRVSGIWQTVWMEEVPASYIRNYKLYPDIDESKIGFEFETVGNGELKVYVEGCTPGTPKVGEDGRITVPVKDYELWTPENPKLYQFTAKYGRDEIHGYFAMRKIDKAKDAKGEWRFRLNNKFFFPIGTLDQGWWPDGLLTPPSEAAMEHDIKTLKSCGYNMMRKHIKVEPRRYYALCDKLGMIVFQDCPSPAGDKNLWDQTRHEQRYGIYRREWKEEIDNLQKVPSILMWIPYNEGWGQPSDKLTENTLRWTKKYDPTRLVNGPSGWMDYEGGDFVKFTPGWTFLRDQGEEPEDPAADVIDAHYYRGPGQCKNHKNRISFLGEFGGLGHYVDGHTWTTNCWGYGGMEDTKTKEGLLKTYQSLLNGYWTSGKDKDGKQWKNYTKGVKELVKEGLAGIVYTQTTDVEIEINGLMTYDRKVLKFDAAALKKAHDEIRAMAPAK